MAAERQWHMSRGDLHTCEQLADAYHAQGLRARVNPALETIHRDCTLCHAQDTDPQGIWLPVQVVPRGKTLTSHCEGCGHTHERHL